MGTVPTGLLERELRKLYLQWLAGLPRQQDINGYINTFQKKSTKLIEDMGGQAASLGALAGFPTPKTLELSPVAGVIYNDMKQAAISASITAGLNAKDAARQMLHAGLDKNYRKLERLARTETVSAYWKNSWDSIEGLGLVMVWSSERSSRTCDYCISRDGMVVEDPNIRDHPNGRCTLVAKLPHRVDYKGTINPDGSINKGPAEVRDSKSINADQTGAHTSTVTSIMPTAPPASTGVADTPPTIIEKVSDANKWGADNVTDLKTLPKDIQEQVRLYTGGGYRGTNQSLRSGVFSGYNGPIQKEMVDAIDTAMKMSVTADNVVVSRLVSMDAFSITPDKLIGKIYSDKGFLSTAVGKPLVGKTFNTQVSMEIIVPKGTPAIWTRPVTQFKGEKELLLDRGTRLKIEDAVFNSGTGRWSVKATVVPKVPVAVKVPKLKPVASEVKVAKPATSVAKPPSGSTVVLDKKTPKYVVDDLSRQTAKIDESYLATISEYTNEGAFDPVNAALRGVKSSTSGSSMDSFFAGAGDAGNAGYISQFTGELDKAIASQKTMSEMTLYRGVQQGSLGDIKRGAIITDKGYMSSTTNPAIATDFSAGGDIMRITYPAGRPALYVDALPDVDLGQEEVLLPRGLSMKVTSITNSGTGRIINVTIQ